MAREARRIKVALRLYVVDGNTKRSKVKTKLYNSLGINKKCNIANHNLLKDMHVYTCINGLTSHLKRIIISRVNERSKQCDIYAGS